MERQRPRSVFGALWGGIQRLTIAYGYKPWRAIGLWLVLVLIGSALFYVGGRSQPSLVWPTNLASYNQLVATYPRFHPIVYSIENSLPLVRFTEWDNWRPTGWLGIFSVSQMLLGWFFATMGVAGLTNLVRKE
jgi:hypothetical protein